MMVNAANAIAGQREPMPASLRALAAHAAYPQSAGHRTAALEGGRLLRLSGIGSRLLI